MVKKKFVVARIAHTEVNGLRQFLKKVEGYDKSYVVKRSENPAEDFVEMWFKKLSKRQEKYLSNAVQRRGGKIVEKHSESQPIDLQTKLALRNAAIYFAITYIPTIMGIPIISPQLGVNIEVFQAAILGLLPASLSFFTRLAIEFRI